MQKWPRLKSIYVNEICLVKGCERKKRSIGLCQYHYMRKRRGYTVDPLNLSFEERFWKNVKKKKGCWDWKLSKNQFGYSRFHNGKKLLVAHRVAYELVRGKIPENLVLDHLCRNRSCVNPDHLEAVTFLENIRRGINVTRKTCKNGHLFDGRNKKQRTCSVCSKIRMKKHLDKKKLSETII